jgi:hypothetical protein
MRCNSISGSQIQPAYKPSPLQRSFSVKTSLFACRGANFANRAAQIAAGSVGRYEIWNWKQLGKNGQGALGRII